MAGLLGQPPEDIRREGLMPRPDVPSFGMESLAPYQQAAQPNAITPDKQARAQQIIDAAVASGAHDENWANMQRQKFGLPTISEPTIEEESYQKEMGKQKATVEMVAKTKEASGEITPKEKQVKAQGDMTQVLGDMVSAYISLDKKGGIVNTQKSALENIGAYFAGTSPGQKLGRIVGTDEQALRDTINAYRPQVINAIRQASQMGARGLDSEKELEFYLSTMGDLNRSVQSNLAAIVKIDEAYGDGKLAERLRKSLPKEYLTMIETQGAEVRAQDENAVLEERVVNGIKYVKDSNGWRKK